MIQNTMLYIRRLSGLKMVTIVIILMLAGAGCKSKKKAMEASNAEKARMEQEAALKKQREEEERQRREAEARAQAERERAAAESKKSEPYSRLQQYFSAISSSANTTAANNSINEALALFASPETPVLIIISGSGDQKDYDRPTTIRDYLNYLKDQKKNANKIEKLEFDGAGKITTVELTKLK